MVSYKKRSVFLFTLLFSVGLAFGNPSDDHANGIPLQEAQETGVDKEAFGRFVLTQVATMMCYRTWETDPTVDFHNCNVCFNDTNKPEASISKSEHLSLVESCFAKYLEKTEYSSECRPMLKDASLPNKPYDILVSEPPFDYTYKNFARCAHGVVFKQETSHCLKESDSLTGVDPFLDRFACVLKNLVLETKKFSEANRKELLGSVPQQ